MADKNPPKSKKITSNYKVKKEVPVTVKETIPNLPISKKLLPLKSKGSMLRPAGDIKPAEEYGMLDKLWDIASQPITAFGYKARGESLPDNFARNKEGKNAFDHVLDFRNPFFYANESADGYENIKKGEYGKAALNAVNLIPLGEKAGMFHKLEHGLSKAAIGNIQNAETAAQLSSKYIPKAVKATELGVDVNHYKHLTTEVTGSHKVENPAVQEIRNEVVSRFTGKPKSQRIIAQNLPTADFMTQHSAMKEEHQGLINNFIK